jgi:polyphenol oxidase
MGNEVFEEFLAADSLYARFFIKKENKWHLNLRKLNRYQLCEAGVIDSSISDLDYCTYCEEDNFYSFRRQKKRNGSMFSFIVLKNC